MAYRKKGGRTLRSRRTRKTYRKRRSAVRKFRRVYRRRRMNTSGNHYMFTQYVPYTAFSSTGVAPNTTIGSVEADMFVESVGYANTDTITDSAAYNFQSSRFFFTLLDANSIQNYAALFEEYKICGINLKIRYVGNGNFANTLAQQASTTGVKYLPNNPSCYLVYRKMHRDCPIPTSSASGWNYFRDASGCKEYRFPSSREINIKITPRVMMTLQGTQGDATGDTAISVAPKRSPWITTGDTTGSYEENGCLSVPHYGIDIMLRAENFASSSADAKSIHHLFNVTAQYCVKFRYRRHILP